MKRQKSYFEVYAHEYDILTNAKDRKPYHYKEISTLVEKFKPKLVLDAGCATGISGFMLAQHNIKTIGIDRSKQMIQQATKNYGHLEPLLTFRYGNFEKLPKTMYNKFDMIVCLANSLSGVGSTKNLITSLYNFNKVLVPGGTLVIQLLNYISIKDGKFLPIRVTRKDNIIYQRFSERQGKRLYIYVNRLDISEDPPKYEMFRHEFENFNPKEIIEALKKTKFRSMKKYDN
ncbi:class I SAM-dependent methyltransferase, partial [Candidatus Zixiibacteriota bacterium]